jgi:hypothetical protein
MNTERQRKREDKDRIKKEKELERQRKREEKELERKRKREDKKSSKKNTSLTQEDIDKIIDINKKIKDTICYDTIEKLTDKSLMDDYMNCSSVKKEIECYISVLYKELSKYNIEEHTRNAIVNGCICEYSHKLVNAGTKGVIRGNKFNKIVKEYITNLNLDNDLFEISFEKQCETNNTSEIPDWFIQEKNTGKVIIGMNQMDLWTGGHQTNRAYKYVKDCIYNTYTCKLVCVICNDISFKSIKNKTYPIFSKGFENNTLSYLNNLKNIIYEYFHIDLQSQ